MGIICNHCIELHNPKAFHFRLCKAVKNQFLTNVFTTDFSSYSIAGITDMSASSYIVRVQDIETDNFIVINVYCDSCIGLKASLVSSVRFSSCGNATPSSNTWFHIIPWTISFLFLYTHPPIRLPLIPVPVPELWALLHCDHCRQQDTVVNCFRLSSR